jgi:hypothetical protein
MHKSVIDIMETVYVQFNSIFYYLCAESKASYRHSTVYIQVITLGQTQHEVKEKLQASTGGKTY